MEQLSEQAARQILTEHKIGRGMDDPRSAVQIVSDLELEHGTGIDESTIVLGSLVDKVD